MFFKLVNSPDIFSQDMIATSAFSFEQKNQNKGQPACCWFLCWVRSHLQKASKRMLYVKRIARCRNILCPPAQKRKWNSSALSLQCLPSYAIPSICPHVVDFWGYFLKVNIPYSGIHPWKLKNQPRIWCGLRGSHHLWSSFPAPFMVRKSWWDDWLQGRIKWKKHMQRFRWNRAGEVSKWVITPIYTIYR